MFTVYFATDFGHVVEVATHHSASEAWVHAKAMVNAYQNQAWVVAPDGTLHCHLVA